MLLDRREMESLSTKRAVSGRLTDGSGAEIGKVGISLGIRHFGHTVSTVPYHFAVSPREENARREKNQQAHLQRDWDVNIRCPLDHGSGARMARKFLWRG
jgi:hypothetical protein